MTRKLLVSLALLLLVDTAGATRVIEQVERAVELTLEELTLPTQSGTTVTFAECPTCSSSTHRLTDTTVFRANGQDLPLAEFLSVATAIAAKPDGAENAIAIVFLDLKTGRISRIELRE